MIEIRPTALYSRADLVDMLSPFGINADSFIARVHPKKRFRLAWWGADLIAAINKAPDLSGDEKGTTRKQRRRKPPADDGLDALREMARG